MGFIKAFTGAISQTFADQWSDYYMPNSTMSSSTIVSPAVKKSTNSGAGSNTKGSENVITNGSKFVVPENYALVTYQDGKISAFISEAGGYTFTTENDPNARSFFSGGGIFASTLGTSWERFKFGGIPSTTQLAFYVNLKTITGNRFGTQQPIRWVDPYLDTQVAAVARGTYNIDLIDPILFINQFLPYEFLSQNARPFDLEKESNLSDQLFTEFVSALPAAFGSFAKNGKEINEIQSDQIGMGNAIAEVLESSYQWSTKYGIKVSSVAVQSLDYDEETKARLEEVRKDDLEIRKMKKMGQAYSDNMQGLVAAGTMTAMNTAAGNQNGAAMGFYGMNMAQNMGASMMGTVGNYQQPAQQPAQQPMQQVEQPVQTAEQPAQQAAEDPYAKLVELKKLLDAGVISQSDFDAAKNKLLGI